MTASIETAGVVNALKRTTRIRRAGRVVTAQGTTFPGTVKVENGLFRYRSEKTGNTGTCTLHEGQGKRVLSTRAADGSSGAELTPARL